MKKRKYNIMYPPIGPYDYDNGMEVHLWEDLEVELHQHDYYEFLICIEGKMEHVLNGTRIDVISKRQAVFITPNDVHNIRAVEGYKARHINISVTKEIFHELCFYLKMSNRSNSVTDLDFARVVRLTAQEYKNFLKWIEIMANPNLAFENSIPDFSFDENSVNEERVPLSAKGSFLDNIPDISSEDFETMVKNILNDNPSVTGRQTSRATFIFGAPGIGKTTIPQEIIKKYNELNPDKKKSVIVIECGDLEVDESSLYSR